VIAPPFLGSDKPQTYCLDRTRGFGRGFRKSLVNTVSVIATFRSGARYNSYTVFTATSVSTSAESLDRRQRAGRRPPSTASPSPIVTMASAGPSMRKMVVFNEPLSAVDLVCKRSFRTTCGAHACRRRKPAIFVSADPGRCWARRRRSSTSPWCRTQSGTDVVDSNGRSVGTPIQCANKLADGSRRQRRCDDRSSRQWVPFRRR